MRPNRVQIALLASVFAFGGAWLLAPAAAQIHTAPQNQVQGIPCRVSFENSTHGGDWASVKGEIALTQITPQADGAFVARGHGQGRVVYHSANSCRITGGNPFTADYDVTVTSQDGRTAQIDISSIDDPHDINFRCPGIVGGRGPQASIPRSTYSMDPPGLPTVTVELHEGSTPFAHDMAGPGGHHAGDQGSVTLHYCTGQNPNTNEAPAPS